MASSEPAADPAPPMRCAAGAGSGILVAPPERRPPSPQRLPAAAALWEPPPGTGQPPSEREAWSQAPSQVDAAVEHVCEERTEQMALRAVRRVDNAEPLILALFNQLNTSGAERLSCAEMRPFAELIGFRGGEAQWTKEFTGVCSYLGCDPLVGITSESFLRLLSDTSKKGCFCTVSELKVLLRKTCPVQYTIDYEVSFEALSESEAVHDCHVYQGLGFGKQFVGAEERDLAAEVVDAVLTCAVCRCALLSGRDGNGKEALPAAPCEALPPELPKPRGQRLKSFGILVPGQLLSL